MPQTKIYANILENQGFKDEALKIYQNLLEQNPEDKELKEAVNRLTKRKRFEGVNVVKLNEFDKINQKNRFEFEKWLSEF
ncbi:MAG: tetratricopeptide repeat protein [Epsilonproteobacteria bacterium]|nr:tetratricopeptide repeat protein [Campylobacterota bacterium]